MIRMGVVFKIVFEVIFDSKVITHPSLSPFLSYYIQTYQLISHASTLRNFRNI